MLYPTLKYAGAYESINKIRMGETFYEETTVTDAHHMYCGELFNCNSGFGYTTG